jgi:DNA-binding NarL/FixJ family response regulator
MRESGPPLQSTSPSFPNYSALATSDSGLSEPIERALAQFGCDLLTAREQDVIRLILLGLPCKVAATKLHITPKTVGVHRRNAYAKLGVRSQTALFRQFLGFLSAAWVQLALTKEWGAG